MKCKFLNIFKGILINSPYSLLNDLSDENDLNKLAELKGKFPLNSSQAKLVLKVIQRY
jgi:hypothetical protein